MLCTEFSSVCSCFNLVFKLKFPFIRAVTKGWELQISPGYYEHDHQLHSSEAKENRTNRTS